PPPLPVTYDDYARTQRARGDSGALAGHIAYWRRTLAGTTPVTVPADRPRPRRRSGAGDHHQFTLLPADRAAAVERTACAHDTTTSTVLLAGFIAWLASLTGQTDIVIGYPVSGREWPAVEHLIGYFVNTLPLRVDVSGDPAFGEVLTRTRDAAAAALAHQDVPFGTLVSELSPHRDPGRTPLFQVIFSVQDRREYREHMAGLPGVRADIFDIHNGTAKFDLDVTVVWRPEGLTGVMEYSTDLIGADTARLLAERYRLVLGAALDDLSQPLSTFQSGPAREPRLSQGAGHPPEAIGRYTLREAANGSRDPGISPATDP
ncbi:MAG TPA: condensation domain-containing protein, partial [Streptosporangiaceae bacterium]